jgi:hypothetical protein
VLLPTPRAFASVLVAVFCSRSIRFTSLLRATSGLRHTIRDVAVLVERPQPPAVLRQELADARARGVDWQQAWRDATRRSLIGVYGEDRDHWMSAFAWADEFFRRAYVGVQFDRCDRPIYPI